MSYLNNYLKVIPLADADIIRENIADNKELFEVKRLTEQEYENLIDSLIKNDSALTEAIQLEEVITADDLNAFYSDVAMDLHKLFPEQNNLEKLGENYDRIYQGHLEELTDELEKLRLSINRLEEKENLQENTLVESYSFEPDRQAEVSEIFTDDTAYLFTDRDGSRLQPAEQEKLFHTYQLVLNKKESINLLVNDKGITTATLGILYESPYTLENTNEEYDISKALDGNQGTFWYNASQKPDNSLDYINIYPDRMKEEHRYVERDEL